VFYPPEKPGIKSSEDRARTRRKANLGWWEANQLSLKMRRRARHLVGYATSPVVIRPIVKWSMPGWQVRDPLSTFPPPERDLGDIHPPDSIFSFSRTYQWLLDRYATSLAMLQRPRDTSPDDLFELLEYVDGEEFVLLACGKPGANSYETLGGSPHVELERLPNLAGMCPAVVPGRITLDRAQGEFDGVLGMYQEEAKMFALGMIAEYRAIFRDTYLVSRPGETADFIAGPYDGRSGKVNIIKGGDIKETGADPSPQLGMWVDRLERAQRTTGGIPSEFGAESPSNVRTGKRGDAVLSAAIDHPIAEAQEIFAQSLMAENRVAVAIDKAFFNKPKSFYVSAVKGRVDYTPKDVFSTDVNVVSYPMARVDSNGLIVGIGQRVGIGIMSKRTAQEMDPMVSDVEMEHDRIVAEALEMAGLQAIQTQVAQGAMGPAEWAKIATLVRSDQMDLAEAVTRVHEELQATQAQPPVPGTPEAHPGLAAALPAGQAGQPPPAIAPPGPSQQNLAFLLSDLHRAAR
jgi:hypothetical protein